MLDQCSSGVDAAAAALELGARRAGYRIVGGTLTPLAGTPNGYGYANGQGANAQFGYIEDLAADAAGNVYVADSYDNRIRKITSDGTVTTLAGSGWSSTGRKDFGETGADCGGSCPACTGTCAQGYANCDADTANGCELNIQTDVNNCGGCGRVCQNTNGTAQCVAGVCQYTCDQGWMDWDKDGSNGCETETTCTCVSVVAGINTNFDGDDYSTGYSGPVPLGYYLYGIVFDSQGNAYVADSSKHVVHKLSSSGQLTVFAGSEGNSGHVYVRDHYPYTIRKINVNNGA